MSYTTSAYSIVVCFFFLTFLVTTRVVRCEVRVLLKFDSCYYTFPSYSSFGIGLGVFISLNY